MEYPFQSNGFWHNGNHESEKELVVLPYVAKQIAFRNIINYFFPNRELIFLGREDYEELAENEKSFWSSQDGLIYRINGSVNDNLVQKICKKLGLVANGNFLLLQHSLNVPQNQFDFYSMYSNLINIDSKIFESTEKLGSEKISYINKRSSGNSVLFPNTYLARPDTAYEIDGIKKYYQIDYFITHEMAKKIFKNNTFLLSGNECCRINDNCDLYNEKKQDIDFQNRYFLKNTYFEILDFPDEQHYINIVKVKAYLLPATIRKEPEELEINEEAVNFNLSLFKIQSFNIFHYRERRIIEYLKKNCLISKKQERYAYKYKSIKCETANGKVFEKNVPILNIEIPSEIFPCILIYNSAANIIPEEFFVELDVSIFKEVYIYEKRMLRLREDTNIKCYNNNPAFVKMEKQAVQRKINLDIKECDVSCLNTEHIRTDGKYFYYRIEDDLYIKVPEKFSECHADLCTDFFFLEKSDLEEINNGKKGVDENSRKLSAIIKEKSGKNIEAENCLIEHPSEWNGTEQDTRDKAFQILHDKMQVWNSNNRNGSFPEEIQDCSRFCYFHADNFENFLIKLHKNYADKLCSVQDTVMHKWMYKQGNLGVYPENYKADGEASDRQTFCNHAVFETIIKVDGNFNAFTGKGKSKENPDRKPRMENFPECPNPEAYPYRASDYWCDILEQQAANSGETGIHRITAEQAFYMARLGYVVVAAWKNLTPKGNDPNLNYSPHFVTVRPCEGEYPGLELLKVAHVGGGTNKETYLLSAFDTTIDDSKLSEIKYYCNIKQSFI